MRPLAGGCIAIALGLAAAQALAQDSCANRGDLDLLYCDENRDLVADPPKDPKKFKNPSTLVFTYTPVEDPAVYENAFKPFTDYLSKCAGKRVVFYQVQSNAAEIEAMRSGRLHVGGFSTGPTNFAVNLAGAVPFAVKGNAKDWQGYQLIFVVRKDSPYQRLADLKGKKVAHVQPSSNSGNLAPRVLFPKEGLVPDKDYKVLYSGKHDQTVMGVLSGDFEGHGISAVIGPSGTGKSTFIRCINRLVEPTAGQVIFEDRDLVKLNRAELRSARRRIGMVFQEYNLVERLSVMENLLCGRLGYVSPLKAWLRRYPARDIARAFELLDIVGLGEFAQARADSLSGGQRQRVGIARAVMQEPKLLLADEPTSSLDPKTSVEIMQLLADVGRARAIPVLINMHDVELAKRFADRIVGMSGGRIIFDGSPGTLSDAMLKQIYGGEDWLE